MVTRTRLLAGILALATAAIGAQSKPAPVDPTGNWKAVFTGPVGPRPKMVSSITFAIQATSTGYSATARTLPNWPGVLDVTDMKLAGNRLTFTGTGSEGWSSGSGGVVVYHCCPQLLFDGTIDGDEMALTVTWTDTETTDHSKANKLPMAATRIARF